MATMKVPEFNNDPRYARKWVIGVAAFFTLFGCLALLVVAAGVPITSPPPFVESESTQRILIGLIATYVLLVGVGLFWRSRIAWYGMFAYLVPGSAIVYTAMALDTTHPHAWVPPFVLVVMFGFNCLIALGIYIKTRAAFHHSISSSN